MWAHYILFGFICLLMLLSLSQEFVREGTPDSPYYQTLGDLLRSGRDFVNHIGMILTLSVGSLMFYFLLYLTELIPRWLSCGGILGTIFTMFASLLTATYIALNLPLIIFERVLAIWFIAKGFDADIMCSVTEKE